MRSVIKLSATLFGANGQVFMDRGGVSEIAGSWVRQIGHSKVSCHCPQSCRCEKNHFKIHIAQKVCPHLGCDKMRG